MYSIKPAFNRLVIFPAGKCLHGTTEVTGGERRAMAINLWAALPLDVERGDMRVEGAEPDGPRACKGGLGCTPPQKEGKEGKGGKGDNVAS